MVQTRRRGRTLIVRAGRGVRLDAGLQRHATAVGLLLVLLLSLAVVTPLVPRMINPYDEGMVAYGAERVLNGQRPAVDFYTPYGPGVFYLIAGAYQVFGTRLLVERWVAALLLVAVGGLSYLLLEARGRAGTSSQTTHSRSQSTGASVGDSKLAGANGSGPTGSVSQRSGKWRALREVRHPIVAGLTALTVVLMLASGWWYTPVNGGSLALLLLSGVALQRALASGSPSWAAAAGAAAGLALLWRLAFGGALLIANIVTWAITVAGENAEERQRNRNTGVVAMIAAATAIALPVYAGLIAAGGQRALLSLLVWPLTSTGAANLPWPPLTLDPPENDPSTLAWLTALTHGASFYYLGVTLLLMLWRLPLGPLSAIDRRLGLWLALMLPPLFLYAHGRTDYLHVTPLLAFSLLLASVVAVPADRSDRERYGTALQAADMEQAEESAWRLAPRDLVRSGWKGLGLAVWIASLLVLVPSVLYSAQKIWESPGRTPLELPGPRGAGVYAPYRYSRQYRALVPLIQYHVAPGHSIFSGTTRHDIYLTNDTLLYFLAERNAATYYWCLDAGVTSTAPVQQQMLAEMSRGAVAMAVNWTDPKEGESNEGGRSSGVRLLDDWVAREFVPMRLPGIMYDVRVRQGLWRAPAGAAN
jgi:hypothetical protein